MSCWCCPLKTVLGPNAKQVLDKAFTMRVSLTSHRSTVGISWGNMSPQPMASRFRHRLILKIFRSDQASRSSHYRIGVGFSTHSLCQIGSLSSLGLSVQLPPIDLVVVGSNPTHVTVLFSDPALQHEHERKLENVREHSGIFSDR